MSTLMAHMSATRSTQEPKGHVTDRPHAAGGQQVRVDPVNCVVSVPCPPPVVYAEEAYVVLEAVAAVVDDVVELGKGQGAVVPASHAAAGYFDLPALDGRHALFVGELDLDGLADLAGQQGRDQHEVRAPPVSERAAGRQGEDADFAQRNAECLVDTVAQFGRGLGGGPQGHPIAVPLGDAGVAPQRGHLLAGEANLAIHDEIRFLFPLADVPPLHDIGLAHVTLFADLRSIGLHRLFRVEHGGQLLVFHLDELQGRLRNVLAGGRHRRHVVPVETGDSVEHLAPVVEPGVLPGRAAARPGA